MKTVKFKCNACGHEFIGDSSTRQCPKCASRAISPKKNNLIWLYISLGVIIATGGAFGAYMFLGKSSSRGDADQITLQYYLNSTNDSVVIAVEGVDVKVLKNEYQIIIRKGDSQTYGAPRRFYKTPSPRIPIAQFEEGETYSFNFERVDRKPISNVIWVGENENVYTRPISAKAPEIAVSKEYYCDNNTYMIEVSVASGRASSYFLDGKEQTSPVFNDVKPRKEPYSVWAVDGVTGLESEVKMIECKPQSGRSFRVTEAKIQEVFDKISRKEMYVGDAMDKISNGRNIKLTSKVDGCADLETLLEYARTNRIRYIIHATINSEECRDIVTSITARRQ